MRTNQGTCINLKPIVRRDSVWIKGISFAKAMLPKTANWPSAKT
jgi:hypothetical protein